MVWPMDLTFSGKRKDNEHIMSLTVLVSLMLSSTVFWTSRHSVRQAKVKFAGRVKG